MDEEEEDIGLIALVHCDDCDFTIIHDPSFISMFVVDSDDFIAIAMCGYCERPITCSISSDLAKEFSELGVALFSWIKGTEISIAEVLE